MVQGMHLITTTYFNLGFVVFSSLQSVPWGFRKLLNWVKDHYGDVDIYITENGYSDLGATDDAERIVYIEVVGSHRCWKLYY